ncbi:fatty acyl-AMP ligase [Nocardiopsis sp. CA-288880]|uniref:fatty acyl-AMP ligase n=1 Tax=Nocardiopsis sp. CA-288880 TaxID=3239995 RepID=UPI003D982D6A
MTSSFAHHVHDVLKRHADRHHYTWVRDTAAGVVEERVAFGEIDERAAQVADGLTRRLETGSRVLLVYASGMDFLPAFLGSLYAGMVPVPAPLPRDGRAMERISGIVADAEARLVLTSQESVSGVARLLQEDGRFGALDCAATDAAPLGDAARWRMPEAPGSETVAFLQYTSGSTSEPKGVVVTHGNLLANEEALSAGLALNEGSVMASWLPHFHDMGLMGGLLIPAFVGGDCVLMSPTHFLRRPVHWLQMMSRHRADATFAPNFAYDLCLKRVTEEQIRELDLSALRACVNGAEPVRARTVADFTERFSAAGLRADAMKPGFGLAEATLVATLTPPGRAAGSCVVSREELARGRALPSTGEGGVPLISSGRAVIEQVLTVDPRTREELPEARVGEIWARGASIARGYWNKPHDTGETFDAYTAEGAGPFLRTGDLGFLIDGELYVTGRSKDTVIINGRNIYPQDIEQVAEAVHPALAGRVGAAFGTGTGPEHVVIVQEVRAPRLRDVSLRDLALRIREAIVRTFDVTMPSVVLISSGIPRTTSGKIRRRACRDAFMSQQLAPLHQELAPDVRALLEESAPSPAADRRTAPQPS